MPLTLNERLQADLGLLARLPVDAVREFCGVCLDFIEQGAKKGVFARAASALGVEPDAVAGAVMALTELLLSAAKLRSSEQEIGHALIEAGLSEESRKAIIEFYAGSARRLRGHLGGIEAGSTPQYRGFDWRLQITVASRFAHDRMEPSYMLRLDTVKPGIAEGDDADAVTDSAAAAGGGIPASIHATADYAALKRISDSLDDAAAEMKTAHSKRVLRYIR